MSTFQRDMYERFPQLFRAQGDPPMRLDGKGIRIGEGWHYLLYALCEEIERHVVAATMQPHPCFSYINEEAGRLRISVEYADNFIADAIASAEQKSAEICDLCGARVDAAEHFWILKPCDKDKTYSEREDS